MSLTPQKTENQMISHLAFCLLICNYSEPCKIAFCECLHSYRTAILYGEVTT